MGNHTNGHPSFTSAEQRYQWLAEQPFRSQTAAQGFFTGTRTSLRNIAQHRHLWRLLVRRELKARYKDSALGYLWTLIRPLVNLLIYYFAIGQILGAQRAIPDFAIYVFAGLTAWNLFASMLSGATASIVNNVGIIKKAQLPRELFPLTAAGAALADFISQMVILLAGALLIRGVDVGSAIAFFPLSFLLLVVWGLAGGILLSALNVYMRDIQYLVEVTLLLGFWLTPSVYSYQMVLDNAPPALAEAYAWNPLAMVVMGFQRAFWYQGQQAIWPDGMFERMLILLCVGLVFLLMSQRVFSILQRNFAQEL